jgi:UDP-glucuronate 4-epimerase
MKILVTGAAGFIGYHLAKRFCERGDEVLGIDNLNDYYDVSLKQARLRQLEPFKNFSFMKMDIADRPAMEALFAHGHCEPEGRSNPVSGPFDRVVHMAAQAGVRYSIENPHAYVQSNLAGFLNILEGCRRLSLRGAQAAKQSQERHGIATAPSEPRNDFHLVYASSSSVYGLNTKMPFSVTDNVDHPISLYGATKKANELMAHTYSHLYGIPTTGLRFFTVYGPWGRPDMALFKFTKAILNDEPIDVYNEGNMKRDFTYIDDIVEGVVRVTDRVPSGEKSEVRNQKSDLASDLWPLASKPAPYRLYNIGSHSPVELKRFISAVENALGKKAKMNFLPMQPGDVPETFADVDDLMRDVGFSPSTPIETGIERFVKWYREFYKS